LDGSSIGPEVSRFAGALEGTGAIGGTGRRRLTVGHGAVAARTAAEVMALHGAGKPLAFGGADDVDVLADGKQVARHFRTDLVGGGVVDLNLSHNLACLHASLLEDTSVRLVELLLVD